MKKKGYLVNGKNWILGEDYLKMDELKFKETIQEKFKGTPVKDISELYKKLHGDNSTDEPEVKSAK